MTITRRNYGRNHGYLINGEKAPGVTAILRMRSNPAFEEHASKVTAEYAVDHWSELAALKYSVRLDRLRRARWDELSSAGLRGTKLHAYAHRLHMDEEIPAGELSDEQAALVDSYLDFLDRTGAAVVAAELVIGSYAVGYCGTADLVTDLPALVAAGEQIPAARWLLDLKTGRSGVFPDSALQTCAYSRADVYLTHPKDGQELPLPALGIERCGAVHVRADGWDLYPLDTGEITWQTFQHLTYLKHHEEDYKSWVGAAADPPAVPLAAAARF